MAGVQVEVGTIVAEAIELAKRHAQTLAGIGVAIAVGYTVLDMLGASGAAVGVNLVVSVLVQYQVLQLLLADHLTPEAQAKRRYGSLFGAGLVSGLGILAGLLVLIVPGIYLAGRWLSSSAFVVAEGKSFSEALGSSWEASQPSQAAHTVAALISALPIVGLLAGGYFFAVGSELEIDDGLTATISINVLSALSSLFVWVFGAAAYIVTRPAHAKLGEVFG